MTISLDRALAVKAVRASGASIRECGRRVGLAKSTVQRILAGEGPHSGLGEVAPDADPDFAGKPRRCATCGRLVTELHDATEVCRGCVAEDCSRPRRPVRPDDEPTLDELLRGTVRIELDLKPEHRRRYEEVRRAREAAEMVDRGQVDLDELEEPTDEELDAIAREDPWADALGR